MDTLDDLSAPGAGPATRAPCGLDLVYARLAARLSPQDAADVCGVNRTTWRRWERGQARTPLAVYRLLLVISGAMPWPAWRGWCIVGGVLYSPDDDQRGWSPALLRAAPWRFQSAALSARGAATDGGRHSARHAATLAGSWP